MCALFLFHLGLRIGGGAGEEKGDGMCTPTIHPAFPWGGGTGAIRYLGHEACGQRPKEGLQSTTAEGGAQKKKLRCDGVIETEPLVAVVSTE